MFANSQMMLVTPLGPDLFTVLSFRGREEVSRLFSLELELLAANDVRIPLDRLVGRPAGLVVSLAGVHVRSFRGVIAELEQGDRTRQGTAYRAELVPQFWLLTKRMQTRAFLGRSVPEIVAATLEDTGVELRVTGAFPPRDYCVQYRETDFEFVSRLLEEEGIFYFFRHAEGGHELVLSDTPPSSPDLSIPYDRELALRRDGPAVFRWAKKQALTPGKVTLRDHHFQLPAVDQAEAEIAASVQAGTVTHALRIADNDKLELYDYPGDYAKRFDGPGGVAEAGDRAAAIRIEEEAAAAVEICGASTQPAFTAGRAFALEQHFDADGAYLLTSVQHAATLDGDRLEYRNEFTCIPASVPFRPARVTAKPLAGPELARVASAPDSLGRIKVKFHWDRDDTGSTWLRVAQVPTGGSLFSLPEVDDEVLVTFLHGDPDRPIVIGSLWNGRGE